VIGRQLRLCSASIGGGKTTGDEHDRLIGAIEARAEPPVPTANHLATNAELRWNRRPRGDFWRGRKIFFQVWF
jgi:hypothetical protein